MTNPVQSTNHPNLVQFRNLNTVINGQLSERSQITQEFINPIWQRPFNDPVILTPCHHPIDRQDYQPLTSNTVPQPPRCPTCRSRIQGYITIPMLRNINSIINNPAPVNPITQALLAAEREVERGHRFLAQGNYQGAINAFTAACGLYPNYQAAQNLLRSTQTLLQNIQALDTLEADELYARGVAYLEGKYDMPLSIFMALELFKKAAEKGIVRAYNRLGDIYYKQNNYPIAQQYYYLAVSIYPSQPPHTDEYARTTEAQAEAGYQLGVMFRDGLAMSSAEGQRQVNPKAGIYWLEFATERSHLVAQLALANLLKSKDVKDYATAEIHYNSLINKCQDPKFSQHKSHLFEAAYQLGRLYYKGYLHHPRGAGVSRERAKGYFLKAGAHVKANHSLGLMFLQEKDYKNAYSHFRSAAISNYGPAQFELGELFKKCLGIPREERSAHKDWAAYWHGKAAANHSSQ